MQSPHWSLLLLGLACMIPDMFTVPLVELFAVGGTCERPRQQPGTYG